jgi:CHAT domain-containing protein
VLGYGAELYWRDLYKMLGNERHADASPAGAVSPGRGRETIHDRAEDPIIEKFRNRYLDAQRSVAGHNAVHCLYLVRSEEIWRWTASAGAIRREILDCTASNARRSVAEIRKHLTTTDMNVNDTIAPDLADSCRLMARMLLPSEVLSRDAARAIPLFLVTADGFLGCVPFEAFDVGSGGTYEPLLARTDVAYARYINSRLMETNPAPGIIISNTRPSRELRSRYLFQPVLTEVTIESETAAALDPEALVLSGASATKANLTDMWEDASYLYFASHIISDPEIPYIVHIPMAEDTARIGIEATYLDVTAIRSADLERCGLVVLSGCSSGMPYVEARTEGPSLGDAFLDAGAGAVIQTFWDVRDDMARELMTSFVRLTDGAQISPINALCEARRQAMHGPAGIRHPVYWTSYAIELGGLPAD